MTRNHGDASSLLNVYQFDVTMTVEKQVLWLEIPVDNVAGVEVVEGFDDAGRIEASSGLIKVTPIPQDCPNFST